MKNIDPVEEEMFNTVDAKDNKLLEEIEAITEKNEKEGYFSRIMEYNRPKAMIGIALIGSIICAASQPVYGGFLMSRMLTYLTIPMEYFPLLFP
jgi:hypothetical protein